jgi:hypothetical protein
MLHFLRRIRRSLINTGATRKYLLYAVGEILLVMIGILLALQVNNWNEEKKERKVEYNILLQMISDLEADHRSRKYDFFIHKRAIVLRNYYYNTLRMNYLILIL